MGIIIDGIIILFIILSVFLGYRKGLVELAIKLCAFLIAIVITFILYQPISNLVINTTSIDETIENAILEKANDVMEGEEGDDELSEEIKQEETQGLLPEAARELAINIVRGGVIILLYILIRIALRFVTALANLVAKLPILKQFNKAGGAIYGALRGIVLIYVCLLIIGIFGQINPENTLHKNIQNSYLGKAMYENNVLNIFF